MKAEHILLLVLAGALVGASLMKLVQRPQPAAVAVVKPVRAEVPRPAPEPLPPPKVEVEATPVPPPAAPLPRVHVPHIVRQAPSRVQAFAAKPSPFVLPPREVPVVVQAQPTLPPPPVPEPARVDPEPVPVTPAPLPPPQPPTVTLNAGMLIPVRLVDGLSAERNAQGDAFAATLDRELVADGFVIAERGARVEGRVVSSGRGALVVQLTRLNTSDGQRVAIRTDNFEKRIEPDHRQDAEKIAGGAAIGAAIGAIAGGGKGAAVGAGVGAGAGTGDVLLTRKAPALTAETRINFRLSAAVTLTERK